MKGLAGAGDCHDFAVFCQPFYSIVTPTINIVQNLNIMLDYIPSAYVASSARLRKVDYLNFEEDELRRLSYLKTVEKCPSRLEVGWD